jgi:hypothetical protein
MARPLWRPPANGSPGPRPNFRGAHRAQWPQIHHPALVLFGSRAHGEARPSSDRDLLLIVAGALTPERERALRSRAIPRLALRHEQSLAASLAGRTCSRA